MEKELTKHSLSTSNSNNSQKNGAIHRSIVFLLKTIFFVIIFGVINTLWKFCLYDDTDSYTRLMMHEMYTSEKNIDVLYIGSSHSFMSVNPIYSDEEFGNNSFNAGTVAQCMDGTYALIKEINKGNNVSTVFLEMYYGAVGDITNKGRNDLISTYVISDQMKPSVNKMLFLFNAGDRRHWVNSAFTGRRYFERFFEPGYVSELVKKKTSKEYIYCLNPGINDYNQEYIGRGYVANYDYMQGSEFMNKRAYGAIDVGSLDSSSWSIYLSKITEYCEKRGIELVLYVAPSPMITILGKGNYDDYHKHIEKYAKDNHLRLYDFNLCSSEYFDATDMTLFSDADHLNAKGAEKFTRLLCDVYKGTYNEDEVLFDSFEEKIRNDSPEVRGIAYSGEYVGSERWDCYIVSSRIEDEDYRVIFEAENGVKQVIKEYSDDNRFEISSEEKGTFVVEWKTTKNHDSEGVFYVKY